MASSVSVQEEESHQQKQGVNGGSFIRTHLLKLSPYQPILPFEVLSTRLGRKPEDIVKLDANEKPLWTSSRGKRSFGVYEISIHLS